VSATKRTQAGGGQPDDLAESVRELSDRIEALQADVRRLGGPVLPEGEPGWADEADRGAAAAASYAWVGAIEAPMARRPAVPRLLLEAVFLAAVAVAAALAELDAAVIAGVMVGAWVLVALIEWAASRADRRREQLRLLPSPTPPAPVPADPAWFTAPVEHTLLEPPADSVTAVSKLPPAARDVEATVERPSSVP
jgi:hypothetical protein